MMIDKSKFLSRRFLLSLLGVIIVVAGEMFGMDEVQVAAIGDKLIWLIGIFVGGDSLVQAAQGLLEKKGA